jgi:hypothetical protein
MSTQPEQYGLNSAMLAQEKTNGPGIFLIMVGVFNLLLSLVVVFVAVVTSNKTEAQVEAEMELARQRFPQWAAYLPPPGQAVNANNQAAFFYSIWAVLAVLASMLIFLAGIRMRSLQSYGLALISSLLACVPLISCCCGLGQIAGIWALVVLMDPEVRTAFR